MDDDHALDNDDAYHVGCISISISSKVVSPSSASYAAEPEEVPASGEVLGEEES
jgi:hypothetical protein